MIIMMLGAELGSGWIILTWFGIFRKVVTVCVVLVMLKFVLVSTVSVLRVPVMPNWFGVLICIGIVVLVRRVMNCELAVLDLTRLVA